MTDLTHAGQLIAQSGILGASNPAEGFIIATTCHQEGMSLLKFGETYHVFNGKISMRSDAMLARFNELGGTHKIISRTADCASIELTRDGNTQVFTLTWDDAKQEPFVYKGGPNAQTVELAKPFEKRKLKAQYSTPLKRMQMLWARVSSDGVRAMDPRANQGSYAPEEVEDFTGVGGGEPDPIVEISAEDASDRAKVIEVDVLPIIDPSVCPIGGKAWEGKPWSEFSDAELDGALICTEEKMTDDHRIMIQATITNRR